MAFLRNARPQVRSPHRHARPAVPRLVHRQGCSGVFRLAGRASHDAKQGGVRGAAAGSASRGKTNGQGGRLGPVFCVVGGHYRPRIFQGCPELWHLVMRSWPPPRYRIFLWRRTPLPVLAERAGRAARHTVMGFREPVGILASSDALGVEEGWHLVMLAWAGTFLRILGWGSLFGEAATGGGVRAPKERRWRRSVDGAGIPCQRWSQARRWGAGRRRPDTKLAPVYLRPACV